jgi:drug/metabolite transporter (DMT)-like permease
MLKSIKTIGGVKTNAILAIVPVSTLIIGFFCLGETITIWQFVGFVILLITTIKIK